MAQVTEKKKLPRHIYKRPQWIVVPGEEPRRPPLPEMEEGCARASPYVRKSFSEKVGICSFLNPWIHGALRAYERASISRGPVPAIHSARGRDFFSTARANPNLKCVPFDRPSSHTWPCISSQGCSRSRRTGR